MKTFFRNNSLVFGLITVLIAVFTFGGIFSRYVAAEQNDRIVAAAANQAEAEAARIRNETYLPMVPGGTRVDVYANSPVSATYALYGNRGDFTPTLEASYQVYTGDIAVAVIYVIQSYGKFENLKLAFAISLADDTVLSVLVLSNQETPNYFAALDASFYAQFAGKPLADAALAVDAVAGSTYSSKGFEIGLLYAREQYAADFGFVIPGAGFTLVSLSYNFDPMTFTDRPYVAVIEFGVESTIANVYLYSDFAYAGLVGGIGIAPDDQIQAAIPLVAAASGLVSAGVRFISYDAGTRTLVMTTRGYNSLTPIQVTFVLNAAFDGFSDYTISSHETYDDADNVDYGEPPYSGAAVPAVEAALIVDYQTDGVITIDTVAGASGYTVPAMKAMLQLLDQFLSAMNGGQ